MDPQLSWGMTPDQSIRQVGFSNAPYRYNSHGIPSNWLSKSIATSPVERYLVFCKKWILICSRQCRKASAPHHILKLKSLNTTDPLSPGHYLQLINVSQPILQFKYKHIFSLCYNCRIIQNLLNACTFDTPQSTMNYHLYEPKMTICVNI